MADTPMITICRGCFALVETTAIPAEPHPERPLGTSWCYQCPACGWDDEASTTFPDLDPAQDAPPPPDPLTVLLPILRHIGLERIAAALGRPLSPVMDAVRATPGLSHVVGTDADLLRTVLRTEEGWSPGLPRWSHVRSIAGHGSGVGHALCVAVGLDPDETAPPDDEVCLRCGQSVGGEE